MTAQSGRAVRFKRDGVAIVGARSDAITFNNEPIDITDKDDSGWRTLLADAGVRTVSGSIEGVLKDTTLIAAIVGGATSTLLKASEVDIDDLGSFTGDFYLNNIALGAEHEGAVTFTANFESSDTITAALAPFVITAPTHSGVHVVGNTLTAVQGTWGLAVSYTQQWQENAVSNPNSTSWADVSGDDDYPIILAPGHADMYLRCCITATNANGSTTAYTTPQLVVAP